MFGLGFGEILIILVVALLLFGAKSLPEVAKQLGKGLRDFRKATEDLKQQFESEIYSEETRTTPRPTLVPPSSVAPQSPPAVSEATSDNLPVQQNAPAEPVKPDEPASPPVAISPPAPRDPVEPV